MRKRTKFLVVAIVALTTLAVGLTTTVLAQDSSGDQNGDNSPQQTFTSKVASILGLEEEQVADAFNQACQEMRDEALEQRLQKAVENGYLTEEEADQIMEWWQDRPEALEEFGLPGLGGVCGGRHGWMGGPAGQGHRTFGVCCPNLSQDRYSGTITAITDSTITLAISEDNGEVTFQYTSDTVFVLHGLTTVEEGQEAIACCEEDDEGNLTATRVQVELP